MNSVIKEASSKYGFDYSVLTIKASYTLFKEIREYFELWITSLFNPFTGLR